MKICSVFAIIFLALAAFTLTFADEAAAARLGGGRSFGGKPYMSTPAPLPFPATQTQPSREAGAMSRPAAQTPQSRQLFGGMGGLFGGLLAGTLIGSLLSGHGFAGGGFMDILFIGFLIYLSLKLFARRCTTAAGGRTSAFTDNRDFSSPNNRTATAGWDRLRADPVPESAPSSNALADFDVEEFLRGAKMAYARLQNSWDKRDLDDIAQFTTPLVLEKVREDMVTDSDQAITELLLVNAQLLHVEKVGEDERAEVFFDVLMHESPDQQAPASVREVWHFLRLGADGDWKLDGIQQVE
ncbi:MAG: 39S ribosomal protein L45 [Desulfovibrio sp.]|jgi:predicted lipid-binding transport protein (Tim44 family)|nr:39S ribosomal protein L45 [Desulfovibrio sp.]